MSFCYCVLASEETLIIVVKRGPVTGENSNENDAVDTGSLDDG